MSAIRAPLRTVAPEEPEKPEPTRLIEGGHAMRTNAKKQMVNRGASNKRNRVVQG